MTLVNKVKDFGDLFKSDIKVIPESNLDTSIILKKHNELKLGKVYCTVEEIKKIQAEIFNYKFEK